METNEIAKTSDITIRVGLDKDRVPVKIEWSATDMHEAGKMDECKAMAVALFDKDHRETLRIDLWTNEMQVQEMDRFFYQTLRSLSQTYLRATQNKELAEEMAKFAHYFGEKSGSKTVILREIRGKVYRETQGINIRKSCFRQRPKGIRKSSRCTPG
ncbi:MAG: gliding motility protein GldC [Lewinellaceae bacterium]|nr:gliding motility protein GldC [Lewinellaceae bacterium]